MQALYLNKQLTYHTDFARPELSTDNALIKLKQAGICATDLELIKGYAGFSGVLGHEFVGVVESVSNKNSQNWIGQRVVGSINIGCNICSKCIDEGPEHCHHRKVLGIRGKDGVFADYFTLPISNLFSVTDDISDDAAIFTEPLAAALRVEEQIKSIDLSNIAVLGPGRLGLLIAKVLSIEGYEVTILGRSDSSLVLPSHWQLKAEKCQNIADNSFDSVVDATGQRSGFEQALRIIKPKGALILKSTFSSKEPVDLNKVVVSELNIIGSRCGPFNKALALLKTKKVPVETMIDGEYHLKDGHLAFDHANQTGIRKIVLRP